MARNQAEQPKYASLSERVGYIAEMADSMSTMIPHSLADVLRYLLAMVKQEAKLIIIDEMYERRTVN